VHDDGVLKRLFERDAMPFEVPTGAPLTDSELKAGLLREVDLFAGLSLGPREARLRGVGAGAQRRAFVFGSVSTLTARSVDPGRASPRQVPVTVGTNKRSSILRNSATSIGFAM
jgi:hypothetical protein